MSKKLTVFVTVLLVLAVVVGILVPASAASKTKLVVWGRDLTDDDPAHAYIKALINGFKKSNPDIDLQYVALGDPGLMDKTKVAMNTGKGLPDIFQSWGGSQMGYFVDQGRLLDLTKDLQNIPGSKAAQGAMSWKGKIYGVAPFFAVAGLYVNEGLFKNLGLTVPKNIEEFEKVCDTLKAKGIQPLASGSRDKWPPLHTYMYLVDRFGGVEAFNNAAARKASFAADAFVKAAQLMQSWTKKGYYGDKPLGEAYGDADILMQTGKAGMQLTGSWKIGQYSDPKLTDQTFGFYTFPELTGGKGTAADVMGMTDIGFAATKQAASKKAAIVRFMKYAMSVEVCAAETGRVCSVPGVKPPSRMTAMASEIFSAAKNVQFWWDQNLPTTMTSPMNDTVQFFLMPDADVVKALQQYEALAVQNMGPVKK